MLFSSCDFSCGALARNLPPRALWLVAAYLLCNLLATREDELPLFELLAGLS